MGNEERTASASSGLGLAKLVTFVGCLQLAPGGLQLHGHAREVLLAQRSLQMRPKWAGRQGNGGETANVDIHTQLQRIRENTLKTSDTRYLFLLVVVGLLGHRRHLEKTKQNKTEQNRKTKEHQNQQGDRGGDQGNPL